jgi:general secretion pathway protein B
MIEGKPLRSPGAEGPEVARAAPAPPAAKPPADTAVSRGLPSGAPRLKLEVLVYSDTPGDRFVFINGRKYQEGQSVEEGVTLERINQDSAVVSYAGQRFTLRE